jgi:acyl carrier protein
LNITGDPPSLDADLREELATTSLEQLTLFMALEDEFDDSIPQEEAERISTLGELVSYIENKLTDRR